MSTIKDDIVHEVASLPEPVARQVLDFVRFLKLRQLESMEPALLSEPALAKDWALPEEDEAWADL